MKTEKNRISQQDRQDSTLKPAGVMGLTFVATAVISSSVVQATDLQIYAAPTAGKKTIVMMLDTSGSMGLGDYSGYSMEDYDISGTCGSGTLSTPTTSNYTSGRHYFIWSSTDSETRYKRNFCYLSNNAAPAQAKKPVAEGGCERYGTIGYKCYDRLTRLKDGLSALLDSNDPTLNRVRIGVGHYSVGGSGNAGTILYPAAELGEVGSTQRTQLKIAVAGLSASGTTPTAAGYTEAAAYLMGTNTLPNGNVTKDFYKEVVETGYCAGKLYMNYQTSDKKCYQNVSTDWRGNITYSGSSVSAHASSDATATVYYSCHSYANTNFTTLEQHCNNRTGVNHNNGWSSRTPTKPADLDTFTAHTQSNNHIIYTTNTFQTGSASYSGFNNSVASSKDADTNYTSYKSPLPEVSDRQSCDGQGVYILSDGIPSSKTQSSLVAIMSNALKMSEFSCTGGLTGGTDWHCKSILAEKLYDKDINPTRTVIQTAFVGFGKSFSDLSTDNVKNACKLSSRSQIDRSSDDACSPNKGTNAVREGGYGNGGFFISNSANDVTESVIQFINNLGVAPLDPLSTGAISVPVDALNPNGFQPFGYLRALEPNPAAPVKIWVGNLKKYTISGGALKDGTNTIFNQDGMFSSDTQDMWNNTIEQDGGDVRKGGAYSRLLMPTTTNQSQLRNLYTDLVLDDDKPVKTSGSNKVLLQIPEREGETAPTPSYVLDQFKTQDVLSKLDTSLRVKLLNYLGFDLDITTTTILPDTLNAPVDPFVAMGGSIHSFPVQLTYEGTLDEVGNLTDIRKQSVLYGSMEGGVRTVDASSGEEQMVFVPADILLDPQASTALRAGIGGSPISHGVSGAWVADATYRTERGVKDPDDSSKDTASKVTARTMNVYGGMRMGGSSYYGLDLMNPKRPKLLFRIGPDVSGYSRMGQSWSKPVLINVRHGGEIKRAMVLGGGYDMCYEDPRFKLGQDNTTEFGGADCNKTAANGNAVYLVDAKNGKLLWSASNEDAKTNNANMKHSIVSRISTLDRDGDNLVDHLYFGDLGGQVFRADLNNRADDADDFGVRVVRLANLGQSLKDDDTGDLVGGTTDKGDSPRFFQPPTITIHDVGAKTFIAVSLASGDRSTPLDVSPTVGRENMYPSTALKDRPVNNVYSLFDHDFVKTNLITGSPALDSENITLSDLQKDPQLLTDGTYQAAFITSTGTLGKLGWYRSLSSQFDGTELAGVAKGGVTRIAGGVKAFEEEPIALMNNLFIPTYDPQGTGIAAGDPCKPRIVGESNRQQFCLPFGVCLDSSSGKKNTTQEAKTGFVLDDDDKNANILGAGIRGITLGPNDTNVPTGKNSCGSLTLLGNQSGAGQWDCERILNPTRWYEKYVASKY